MYKITIGLEIHTQLLTNSKMFSGSKNEVSNMPNININEIDLGMPGTMPSVNEQAVKLAVRLAKILDMEIDPVLRFDRKNYFYQDLPKGYQITQQFYPIGKNGKIIVNNKNVHIERIHLEEDTAKQIHEGKEILLDYNRAGIPLIEIVTKPEIHNKEECIGFLTELKRILTFFEISDGKMENASLRVDLNISISDTGKLGTKVEIKNINSFSAVTKAIDYEYDRQSKLLSKKLNIEQETRKWDESSQTTITMRKKTGLIEYRYMTEPNILPVDIHKLIENEVIDSKKDPQQIKSMLVSNSLNENIINQLLDDYQLFKIFMCANKKVNDFNLTTTWIIIELIKILNDEQKKIESVSQEIVNNIIEMMMMIKSNQINGKQAKTLIEQIYKTKQNPKTLISKLGFEQITDKKNIRSLLIKIINDNIEMVNQNKDRRERVEKFILGLLMKETKGQANPNIAKTLLDDLLNNK
ncbi:MAG: Asp-tRNA(Asn)/Glu-tRNA(Gln) amidotransferase subunit GatB [Mycoplasmataceae bacterium]|nr:Asp-tRNA(Asn)/Glu-tRNA(Gln) amidotransferase subunit GatB [Mycoplasmataceae bacterium]